MNNKPLQRRTPESQGISSRAISNFVNTLDASDQEIHSFMLLKHGYVIAEGWWSPYTPEMPHMIYSLSKSFTATAVGMAISEGHFTVDDTVLSFFPDAKPDSTNEYLAAMQVKHLLSMSTGHEVDTFPFMVGRTNGKWTNGFFDVPVLQPPGTHFCYNTGATYMLSEIVQRTTSEKLLDYLTPRLFEPLGIRTPTWHESPQGVSLGGTGLNLITEDIARFGQLYLQMGVWRGERLLSEAWVDAAKSKQVANANEDSTPDWSQGYGYQFWLCQHGIYRGDGAFGQFCLVMDDYDAVLAMTCAATDLQAVLNRVWDILLPHLATSDAPPHDSDAHAALTQQTNHLQLEPLAGSTTSTFAAQISGTVYTAETSVIGIDSIQVNFDETGCTLTFNIGERVETIIAPYGKWSTGRVMLFNQRWLDTAIPYAASGAWLADNRYCAMVRLIETPHAYTITAQFEDNQLTLTFQINLSLFSTEAQVGIFTAEQQS